MGQKTKAQDWANLNKYQNENATLAIAEPGKNRIVFMGDSITNFGLLLTPIFFPANLISTEV
jgi:hypothetical protein